jgi:hypothetical protein
MISDFQETPKPANSHLGTRFKLRYLVSAHRLAILSLFIIGRETDVPRICMGQPC